MRARESWRVRMICAAMDELLEREWLPIEGADFAVRFESATITEFPSSGSFVRDLKVATGDFDTCVIAGAIPRARYSRARVRLGRIGEP